MPRSGEDLMLPTCVTVSRVAQGPHPGRTDILQCHATSAMYNSPAIRLTCQYFWELSIPELRC